MVRAWMREISRCVKSGTGGGGWEVARRGVEIRDVAFGTGERCAMRVFSHQNKARG